MILQCDFRTGSGVLMQVGIGLILHGLSPASIQWIGDAFDKLLPVATKLRAFMQGSVCFVVQAETRTALKALWDQYQDGTLQRKLQEFLVTKEIRQLADGEEVSLSVHIDEQEYKSAWLSLIIAEEQGNDP